MKLFVVLNILCVIVLVKGIPLDNDGHGRYFLFANDKGNLRIIDSWDNDDTQIRYDPEVDIKYFLHTRNNPTEHQEIIKGDVDSLLASHFNASNPVKFTIHGWEGDYTSTTNTLARDAFLSIADVNMITVDWGIGAEVGYLSAVSNTLISGPSVAGFLNWLNDMGVPFSNMHLIGHSLGGQLSGLTGRNVRGTVEHITALDPAHPMWGPNSERIRKTDAKYVEILHTNAGILGMTDAVGHNDFYPNGGRNMAGCGANFDCSHSLVRKYFAESVAAGGFTSIQCNSVAEAMEGTESCTGTDTLQMGGPSVKPELGIFALNTNPDSPYSQG